MTLAYYNKQYEDIVHSTLSSNRKAFKLAELMTELERVFRIPTLRKEAWEAQNKAVIALYRKVSLSREL